MIETKEGYKFESTGREFYANGYIGLSPRFDIAQGYDGCIVPEPEDDNDSCALTLEEAAELSGYMIKLWSEFPTKYDRIIKLGKTTAP